MSPLEPYLQPSSMLFSRTAGCSTLTAAIFEVEKRAVLEVTRPNARDKRATEKTAVDIQTALAPAMIV